MSRTSEEEPTLKVRFATDRLLIGTSCDKVAEKIVQPHNPWLTVLDSKWGRKPPAWRENPTWGSVVLTEKQQGVLEAARSMAPQFSMARQLVNMIDEITDRKYEP